MRKIQDHFLNYGLIYLIIATLIYEYCLTHSGYLALNRNWNDLGACIVFLTLIVVHTWKKGNTLRVLKSFFLAHQGESNNFFALFNIVFVFIQLHILGTEVHEAFIPHAGEQDTHINLLFLCVQLLSYVALLFIPFFIHALFIEHKLKIEPKDRKVLVTGLSYNASKKIEPFIKDKFSLNYPGNWNPIRKSLEKYFAVSKLILLVDNKARSGVLEAVNNLQMSHVDKPVETILQKFLDSIRQGIGLEIMYVSDFNYLNEIFTGKKKELEEKLSKDPSREIMFNLSSGTSATSAAITLFSIKGNRGLCYLTQESRENEHIVEFDVSVFDLEDVFSAYLAKSH